MDTKKNKIKQSETEERISDSTEEDLYCNKIVDTIRRNPTKGENIISLIRIKIHPRVPFLQLKNLRRITEERFRQNIWKLLLKLRLETKIPF
ncbi:hypothetical protein TNCT_622941 [Trichonephila clavata]|uniref:Uncharacterized protein n=1 Tax=Trichonephila clavata TaxID=2740835 RepID=A0A8X6GYP6_TRICU|nr:hypothetical protein TNCT_622941 [Trichonephila clavata]